MNTLLVYGLTENEILRQRILDAEYNQETLGATFRAFLHLFATGLIDAVFLVLWVVTQWFSNSVIGLFDLQGLDQWVYSVFQYAFGMSTLVPVVLFIVKDIWLMILRTSLELKTANSRYKALSRLATDEQQYSGMAQRDQKAGLENDAFLDSLLDKDRGRTK